MTTNHTKRRAERAARSVVRELGLDGRPITESDFFAVCASRGISVLRPGMVPGFDAGAAALGSVRGFAMTTEAGPLIVVLSLLRGEPFNLRTALHELGHVLLGHLDGRPGGDLFDEDPKKEKEADEFADLLLLRSC